MKQTVYIYKCDNSTIQIKGKVNAITMGKLFVPLVKIIILVFYHKCLNI